MADKAALILGDVSSGIIQNVKWNISPQNSVEHAVNFVFSEKYGEACSRKGLTITGSRLVAADQAVNGMHYFSAASKSLAAVPNVGGTAQGIWYYSGSSWALSDLTGDTYGLKTRFATLMGVCVRLNGTDAVKASSNGSSWGSSTVLDTANMPNGSLVTVFKAQMVISGVTSKPDSLFISSVPNAGGTAISWTSGNREIVINPDDDAGNVTALGKVNGVLVAWKDRAMYTWNNHTTQADEIISIGCSSQESVANFGTGLISFFNDKGFWQTDSTQPVLISRRIQKWIDGMSSSYYQHVACYGDSEYLYGSIGDCTVDGVSYSNVVVRYTFATKEWSVFSYAYEFRTFSKYTSSGAVQILGGSTTGYILQLESSSKTDNGTNISFQLETHELDLGSRGIKKSIPTQIVAYAKNPQGAVLQVKIDNKDWITIGSMNETVNYLKLKETLGGHYFKFRVIGMTSGERVRIQGIELPNITLLDYVE